MCVRVCVWEGRGAIRWLCVCWGLSVCLSVQAITFDALTYELYFWYAGRSSVIISLVIICIIYHQKLKASERERERENAAFNSSQSAVCSLG